MVVTTVIYVMNATCEDMSASDMWQAGVTDERITDVSVLSDMIEIRSGLKTCNIFSYDDVNDVFTKVTVFKILCNCHF